MWRHFGLTVVVVLCYARSTRIRIFLNLQLSLSLASVHMHAVNWTANPDMLNPLSRVERKK